MERVETAAILSMTPYRCRGEHNGFVYGRVQCDRGGGTVGNRDSNKANEGKRVQVNTRAAATV